MGILRKIEHKEPFIKPRKRVAAYCRVSRDSEHLLHSFSAQVSYYSDLIQRNPEWVYAGVYADEACSGTRVEGRNEFQRLMADCDAGLIDIVLTKSVSRFGRNTVDLLESVRHLRGLGIDVRFEEQNISTMSGDGELMLTILASFAQEESVSQSTNVKWSKKKTAEKGCMTNASVPYGYRYDPETKMPVIIPEQAEVVRMIFNDYVYGKMTVYQIVKKLNALGVKPKLSDAWGQHVVRNLLKNVTYTGNMIFGKYYTPDPLTHKIVRNKGEMQMYYAEGTHEAIIDRDTFDLAQAEIKRCSELGRLANTHITYNQFTGKIICSECGRPFGRMTGHADSVRIPVWTCKKPGGKCPTPLIRESDLETVSAEVLRSDTFSPEAFTERIDRVLVDTNDLMTYFFKDGSTVTYQFTRRSKLYLEMRRKKNG